MSAQNQQQQTYNKSRLKLKRRLAASLLKCGKQRIWMDPSKLEEIAFASNRRAIKRLIDDDVIVRKPQKIRSRYRVKRRAQELKRGRHGGAGCVRGSKNARHDTKKNWIRRCRVLRALLHRYRESGKISKTLHRRLYVQIKGGNFKTKRALLEEIFKMKEEEKRQQKLVEEIEMKKKNSMLQRKRKKDREQRRIEKKIAEAEQAAEMMKAALQKAQQQKISEKDTEFQQ